MRPHVETISTQQDPQKQYDLRRKEVREGLLAEAHAPPGPETPNIYKFGTPCGTFCDWMKVNGGTRTFTRPEGDGSNPEEVEANGFVEFTCDMCEALDAEDKDFA